MIISHKYKFIFIKTRKTAGTSVEVALSDICGKDDVITPISKADESLRTARGGRGPQNYHSVNVAGEAFTFFNHISASEVRCHVSDSIWNGYFKFCFERHPCEKIISLYHHGKAVGNVTTDLASFIADEDLAKYSDWHKYTEDDAMIVDFVGRYETLSEDLKKVLERLGVPLMPELPLAKGGFRRVKMPYHVILDDAQIARIKAAFSKEVSYFGY